MSKHDNIQKPLSLAQHFEVPQDHVAMFGWVCGYSADAIFMDEAVERFTRQTRGQRAYTGKPSLALWLDPGHAGLSLVDLPGVLHLPVKRREDAPFNLLHAKVALLGFRHETDPHAWKLRLLVSTGNWTQQTMERSLDLVWRIDLASAELTMDGDEGIRQKASDITEAVRMFSWLRPWFDERILALPGGAPMQVFEGWLREAGAVAGGVTSRFFHSIDASMGNQITPLVSRHAGTKSRNYLAMGSGFYESTGEADEVPGVLRRIVEQQKTAKLLTSRPELDVYVNHLACQGVGTSTVALARAGFAVRRAQAPETIFDKEPERTLHAKFMLGAYCREDSHAMSSAWVYLGSANLTGLGFERRSARGVGNLEAGVVFATGELYWKRVKDRKSEPMVTDLLPLQWDSKYEDGQAPGVGPGMEENAGNYVATPVAWVNWATDGAGQWLVVPEGATHPVVVLDADEQLLMPDAGRRVPWQGSRPRQVVLQWEHGGTVHREAVPVLDALGRLAATELPRLQLDEAWWQLMSFPQPPDEDDLPPEDPVIPVTAAAAGGTTGTAGADAIYPIRQMMQLVENIASKQTSVVAVDWPAWCARLEQSLVQAAASPAVEAFRDMKLNPLSPLRAKAFRPAFAETGETPEGLSYEAALDRVQFEWAVAELDGLGGQHE